MLLNAYKSTRQNTIGVELEVQLVDDKSLNLVNNAKKIKANMPKKISEHLHFELFLSLLEIVSPICKSPKEVEEFFENYLQILTKTAKKLNTKIVSFGVFPKKQSLKIIQDERYLNIKKQLGILFDDFSICGLHIHIGFINEKAALNAYNACINYLPIFIALLSNSSIFDEKDTGFLSYRRKMFHRFPKTGISQYFEDFKQMQECYRQLEQINAIEKINDIWWDLRINSNLGTLELRVGDSVSDLRRIRLAVALYQAICFYFQNEADIKLPYEVLKQNNFNTNKEGFKAKIFYKKSQNLENFTKELVKKLDSAFTNLGTKKEAKELLKIIKKPNLAQQQRKIFKAKGIQGLIKSGEFK